MDPWVAGFALVAIALLILIVVRVGSAAALQTRLDALTRDNERLERELREELARARQEAAEQARAARGEQGAHAERLRGTLDQRLTLVQADQRAGREETAASLKRFSDGLGEHLGRLTESVERRLQALQTDNAAKLEQMRSTVDEKLHQTLETRLAQSFTLVSERLEQVQKGLGEMQALAAGVGDLKRVLTNVKTRGTWGEVQLGSLLEQMLTPDQYDRNVKTRRGSNDPVEFAIRLPGRDLDVCWLPIDAKFPLEDYQRMLEAQELGDSGALEEHARALEARIRLEARTMREKYVDPPATTDFALLYVPTEGLYAEVLRRPGLAESLQLEHRVTVTGPTTLTALLNSLQMGFRTLAIEQRSSEVWTTLSAVKTEFAKFAESLAQTRKKLQEASNTIGAVERRTRVMNRALKEVESLPEPQAAALLLDDASEETEDGDTG